MSFKKNKSYIFEEDLYKNNKATLFNKNDYYVPKDYSLNDSENNEKGHKVNLKEMVINDNPFLNNQNHDKSIEDYPVIFKRSFFKKEEVVYLGSIIRNEFISVRKKWKIFKKTLNVFSKDYYQKIKNLQQEKKSNQIVYADYKEYNLSKGYKRTLVIVWLINILITVICKIFFDTIFQEFWFMFITILSYVFLGGMLIYQIVIKKYNSKISNIQKRFFKKVNKYFAIERKQFKMFYHRLYKYYNQNIHSQNIYYAPLDFNDYWMNKYSYEDAVMNNKSIQKNNENLVRSQAVFKIIIKIAIMLDLLIIFALIVMIIIKLI